MRYLLLLLLLSLSLTNYAQDGGWPIVENCLGELPYPTIPQEDWDFEGVIFTYNGVGVRAIRTDIATSFYIAFEDDTNFTASGSFSADGRWFAYPTGREDRYVTMIGDSHYYFTGLAVVSADPRQVRTDYELPEEAKSIDQFVNFNSYANFVDIRWLDSENLVYSTNGTRVDAYLNIVTGEITSIQKTNDTVSEEANHPENRRDLDDGRYIGIVETEEFPERILALFDSSGELIEEIMRDNIYNLELSPNGQNFIFVKEALFYLANLDTRTIENLCLDLPFSLYANTVHKPFVWSPDGNYLAFLYDGYPVLLNLETREMQILRYETWSLMGWYPIANE